MHEERLFYSLRRDGDERSSCPLDLRRNQIHRLHLPPAKPTPPPPNKAQHELLPRQQGRRGEDLAVVVRKFECGSLRPDRNEVRRQEPPLEFSNGLPVNGLSLGGSVLRDQFLAFGKDLAKRPLIGACVGSLQRSPLP